MINDEDIKSNNNDNEKLIYIKDRAVRNFIMSYLGGRTVSKRSIFFAAEKQFGTFKTDSFKDDNILKSKLSDLLQDLVEENLITKTEKGYSVSEGNREDLELFESFKSAVNKQGGRFFEIYSVNLLTAFFKLTKRKVISAKVIGGSDDGGIDGEIDTEDYLGFKDKVLLQAKNRENIKVSTKEVREFYGVLCVNQGSRGIYITTSEFHPDADDFIHTIDNCVGIDGKKIFDLAKMTGYGLINENGNYKIDDSVINSNGQGVL